MTDDPEPSGAKPQSSLVNATVANVQAPIAGRDNNLATTPQTGTLDLSAIMPFALQLKEQGDIEKIRDAIDIFKSSIAVLERAVAAQGMA